VKMQVFGLLCSVPWLVFFDVSKVFLWKNYNAALGHGRQGSSKSVLHYHTDAGALIMRPIIPK